MSGNWQELSLYYHIPFCTKKCDYCHFYVLPDKEPLKDQLLDGFRLEWKRWQESVALDKLKTVYFGGGTPSLFGPERIAEVLSWHPSDSLEEITLEANPENVSSSLMKSYADAGINRVSIGIQSLDNQLLKKLGRLHDSLKALETVHLVKDAGINNISIDLMYDLPGQTLAAWENSLKRAIQLPITHISLYNLTIEPHTVFFKYREALSAQLPDEDTSLAMYKTAIQILEEAGFAQYEISAFSKPGYESKHNTGYWTARPFVGLGPSAFSYWEGKRFRNIANLSKYRKALLENRSPVDFEECLEKSAAIRELLAIQLRLVNGVDLLNFEAAHGPLEESLKVTISELEKLNLVELQNNTLRLTRSGTFFYDSIATELI